MTTPTFPPLHDDLLFHGPLSQARAHALVRSLGSLAGRHVVDLGCGWAELLLQAVATDASATGYGLDTDATAIEHGRANAEKRGLADRVTLDVGDAGAWSGRADVLIVNGATQVWGGDPVVHTENALTAGRTLLRPGGRLLLGECYWQREPTDAQLEIMGIPPAQYRSLPDLVDLALAHGYRMWWLSRASHDEWDEFESRHALGWERWLADNPGSEHAADVRASADGHRTAWLRGWQDVLGYAYLTLALPSAD
ncbi:MAG TPA: methyltransferase domain-containing protein [Pseudonocardiaceae bacterium]|nr:methyltransferase domain-containing protein [Pseudonocardiaceae bacterium]